MLFGLCEAGPALEHWTKALDITRPACLGFLSPFVVRSDHVSPL